MRARRPDHVPTAELCTRCGQPASNHRKRNYNVPSRNTEYVKQRNKNHPRENPSERIIGIDGEGQGRGPHLYTYLAAADERGGLWSTAASKGLSTEQCLDFLLSLPRRSLIFGYAFLYDLTKWMTDLPDRLLYLLFHEERRQMICTNADGKLTTRFRPIIWGRYKLNYMNRRFSVAHLDTGRSATLWDIFRFFQGKFTKALIDWQIAAKERLQDMERMKDLRASFDKMSVEAVHEYCNEECLYLAKLGRQLLKTHDDCGLTLKSYYGAGSTASVLLEKMEVLKYRADPPPAMKEPLACAFFGGRFENSCVGLIEGPVYGYDISSAYPYQAMLLPCLACGAWEFSRSERELQESRLALVNWIIAPITSNSESDMAWGTLPVRSKDGTIAFPLSAKGGWIWKDEFLAARKVNSNVDYRGFWRYRTDCYHQPFRRLGEIYRERVRIGKDAKGIVLKLGPNSVYGKVAQSRGGIEPPFQSWIWAGNITSGCRAQLLEGIYAATNRWDVLMFATDGIWSRAHLSLPKPEDTGTSDLSKPLGGWEEKVFQRGVFAVRPGIYFPLSPTEDELKEVRARGLGKKVLYEQWPRIVEAWNNRQESVTVGGIQRFIGAKSGVSTGIKGKKRSYSRSKFYGEWVDYPIKVTFHPAPKRERILSDGRLTPWLRLGESVPYNQALLSPEAIALRIAELVAEEQPNADFTEIE